MLILSRKVGEAIAIGADVKVRVTDIRGDVVRLGIIAPRDVSVDRTEVRERKDAEPRAMVDKIDPWVWDAAM